MFELWSLFGREAVLLLLLLLFVVLYSAVPRPRAGLTALHNLTMPCEMEFFTQYITHSHRPVNLKPVRRIFTFHGLLFQVTRVFGGYFTFCLQILPGKTLLSIVGSLTCTPQCSVHEGTSVFRLIRKTSTWTHHLGKEQGGENCCPTWIRTRNLSLPRQVHLPLGHPAP